MVRKAGCRLEAELIQPAATHRKAARICSSPIDRCQPEGWFDTDGQAAAASMSPWWSPTALATSEGGIGREAGEHRSGRIMPMQGLAASV